MSLVGNVWLSWQWKIKSPFAIHSYYLKAIDKVLFMIKYVGDVGEGCILQASPKYMEFVGSFKL